MKGYGSRLANIIMGLLSRKVVTNNNSLVNTIAGSNMKSGAIRFTEKLAER